MSIGLLATKVGMTQIFTEDGVRVPVTVLKVDHNFITQTKTESTDGYTALQVAYGDKREKLVNKPRTGVFKKAGIDVKRHIREFRVDSEVVGQYKIGDELPITILEEARSLDISGVTKGKGFAGVMKRHNMKGFRATHGTHEYFRHGGSIGCRSQPGKVFKGKKMPGQMGNMRVTLVNCAVAGFSPDARLIFIRGGVPGGKGALLELVASQHKARAGRGIGQAKEAKSRNPMKQSKAGGR